MTRRKLPRADDTRPRRQEPKRAGCKCMNHLGTAKQQHATRAAAERQMIRSTRHTGVAYVYQCPTSEKWHVGTRRTP